MKMVMIIILCSYTTLIAAQKKDTAIQIAVQKGSIDKVKERSDRIVKYADSINHYRLEAPPTFIFDACFDYNSDLWEDLHTPTSLRWKVLKHVTNKQALRRIMTNYKARLETKCTNNKIIDYPFAIPKIKCSFFQLMSLRYKEL